MKLKISTFISFFLICGSLSAQTDNNFSFKLFKLMRPRDKNFVYSPFSIYNAGAMLYVGSEGATENEISNLFGFEPDKELFLDKMSSSETGKDSLGSENYKFISANSLWFDKNFKVKESYQIHNEQQLGAKVFTVDFKGNAESERLKINLWISAKTFGKISELLPPKSLDQNTHAVLTNAVYFKALWEKSFDSNNTGKAEFDAVKGKTEVDFMNKTDNCKCLSAKDFTAVLLPYKEGKAEMLIVMPNEPKNTETFFDNFNSEQISLILKTAESEKIQLSVPKFTGKCDFELSESLKKGGMIRSFSDTADFSSMSDVPHLHVSKAYHSAFIEVNETGTEASAATALVMERSLSANLKHITINHPFLYFILDIKTEQILFMGACFEPIFEEKK